MQGTTDQKGGQAPMIGNTLNHYQITDKLGEGGMGGVFLVDDTSLLHKVALKSLPPERQEDEAAHKRFIREAVRWEDL